MKNKLETKVDYDELLIGWYENGQKESEKHYKDERLDGIQTFWYENGQKKHEGNYKNGLVYQ